MQQPHVRGRVVAVKSIKSVAYWEGVFTAKTRHVLSEWGLGMETRDGVLGRRSPEGAGAGAARRGEGDAARGRIEKGKPALQHGL